MHFPTDNEYQDSRMVGSLVGALELWRALVAARQHTDPRRLGFTIACPSEARARRVAAHLRRHRAFTHTTVLRVQAEVRKDWRVEGSTRAEIQSLANLERLFTWLRRNSHSQQVELLQLQVS